MSNNIYEHVYDCIIIGAGIAGVSAAIYLKRADLDILLIDKGEIGGLLNTINAIDNYPAYAHINGPDLALKLAKQVEKLNLNLIKEEVKEIKSLRDFKKVITNENVYIGENVIISTGRSQKTLGLDKELELLGKGISTCALSDANDFAGLDIAVVGGGNSALQESLYMSKIVNKIYIIHRRDSFSAEELLVDKIKRKRNIEIIYNNGVKKLKVSNNHLSGIVLNDGKELNIRGLFLYVGFTPKTRFIEKLNITNEQGYIITDKNFMTKIDGIYAAGDIVEKNYYQLITAANDGVVAALDIIDKQKQKEN